MKVWLIQMILSSAGFLEHTHSMDPRQVLPLCDAYQPDLIVLHLQMTFAGDLNIVLSQA